MELNAELDRLKKDNKKLNKEISNLVEENAKMTKRRSKYQCKIKELEKEKKDLLTMLKDLGGVSTKEFKQLFKKYKKQLS